jgi:hypothetical protein
MSDYGPQVKLARLYEKTSKTGNQYFVRRLGMAKVAVLKSKEVAEDGSPMWDVLLQEAPSEPRRKPEAKEEAHREAPAAAAPYSAKRLPDDSIPF